jgi:hypothetical protein
MKFDFLFNQKSMIIVNQIIESKTNFSNFSAHTPVKDIFNRKILYTYTKEKQTNKNKIRIDLIFEMCICFYTHRRFVLVNEIQAL